MVWHRGRGRWRGRGGGGQEGWGGHWCGKKWVVKQSHDEKIDQTPQVCIRCNSWGKIDREQALSPQEHIYHGYLSHNTHVLNTFKSTNHISFYWYIKNNQESRQMLWQWATVTILTRLLQRHLYIINHCWRVGYFMPQQNNGKTCNFLLILLPSVKVKVIQIGINMEFGWVFHHTKFEKKKKKKGP